MASFFDTLFGGGAQEEAAAKNAAALQTYQGTALPALQTGYDTGTTNLNSAIGAYQPLVNLAQNYNQGGSMWANSLGLNGQGGTTAAQNAFVNNPGYSGAIDAGISAIDRMRAGQGMSNSGNANLDAQTFGQNLQNQQYQNWQNQLQQMAGLGANATSTAAAGTAGGYTNLANLAKGYGEDQSSLAGNVASGTMADNNMVAAGQAAGAKNLLGAGLSLASLAAGGGFGGSLLGQGLGSALGGATGQEWGGSAIQPLPGLSASDYGSDTPGGGGTAGIFAQYGLSR